MRALGWCLGWLMCAALGAAQEPTENTGTHTYSIQETRMAKARLDAALEHIAAARWIEALDELQRLIEEHPGDVLAGALEAGGRRSQQPVHVSASVRARELLLSLPDEARQRYRARYANAAQAGLNKARAQRDRHALAELARRYPLTDQAAFAWWSLGDLEYEAGREREAFEAYSRAIAANPSSTGSLSAGRSALVEELRVRTQGVEGLEAQALGSFLPSLRARLDLRAPSKNASAWPEPYRLGEIVAGRVPSSDALQLTRAGDQILVALPRRVIALNAFSGARNWECEEPSGWSALSVRAREELSLAVHDETAQYAAAANDRVVVSAQQLPFAINERQTYGNMEIMKPMPERRLAAFDLASGQRLWSHRPPSTWDGTGGTFLERMNICGPPVVVGDRVIAPFCRIEGRIDLHVASIDIDTGELNWSRSLISGQRELNMFGRQASEFCAPPVVVEGGQVLVLTGLGTIAALDFLTGELLWQTAYEQIPIERNISRMEAQPLVNVWRQTPPWIVGSTLIATPYDSPDLVALDIHSGALLWSLPYTFFLSQGAARYRGQELTLVGANERSVYVLGTKLLALSHAGGLAQAAPRRLDWDFEHEDLANPSALARPVLTRERLILPLLDARVEIELAGGRVLPPIPWESTGNLLVGKGELFRIARGSVQGFFEWEEMLARARAEADARPELSAPSELLARLLCSSAESALESGAGERARSEVREADQRLALAYSRAPLSFEQRALQFRVLRLSARVEQSLANLPSALEALRRARALSASPAQALEVLLEEHALSSAPEQLRLLDEFERSGAGLVLSCVRPAPSDASSPARMELYMRPGSGEGALEVPVRLWVLAERLERAAKAQDVIAQFELCERVLEDFESTAVGGRSAGDLARMRISELFAESSPEQRAGYETRARLALERARQASDPRELARLPQRWPLSQAAQSAAQLRIELAAQSGDPSALHALLAEDGKQAPLGAERLALWIQVAHGYLETGRTALGTELFRSLALSYPAAKSPDGSTLAQRAEALLAQSALAAPSLPVASFQADPPRLWALSTSAQILGATQHADQACLLVSMVDPEDGTWKVTAWNPTDLTSPRWSYALERSMGATMDANAWRTQARIAHDRLLISSGNRLIALNTQSGELVYERALEVPGEALAMNCANGVAVVLARAGERSAENWLVAFDAYGGTRLWSRVSPGTGPRALPLMGSDKLCFLPTVGGLELRFADLYTGADVGSAILSSAAPARLENDAWIEGRRLFVPWIDHSTASMIECFSLDRLQQEYRVELGGNGEERRQLAAILHHEARTWVYLRPTGANAATRAPQLAELSTSIGAVAYLANVRLSFEDRLLGSRGWRRRTLPSPEIFVISRRPQNHQEARVRCIDLTSGERWATTLLTPFKEISGTQTPQPAVGADCVMLAYTPSVPSDRSNSVGAYVVFLDRASGVVRADKRALPQEYFGRSDNLEFAPLGSGLLVRGERRLEMWQ